MSGEAAGVVLAGGKSSRFHTDKRLFNFKGKTLLEISAQKIKNTFSNRYISIGLDEGDPKIKEILSLLISQNFTLVKDKLDSQGPLMGIYSTLPLLPKKGGVFIPVDMPLLPEGLLSYLSSFDDVDIVYLNYGGRIYPLPGYFSKKCFYHMEEYLKKGDNSIVRFILGYDSSRCLCLLESELLKFGNPELFLINVNTQEDAIILKEYMGNGNY